MNTLDRKRFGKSSDLTTSKSRQVSLQGIERKFWINLESTDFLYKVDDENKLGFAELFYSHICNKLGINCVNVYPAHDKKEDTKGVIVESFVSSKKTNLPLGAFLHDCMHQHYMGIEGYYTYSDFTRILGKFQKREGFVLAKGFLADVRKMILLDFLFGNEDRHLSNVEVYAEKNIFGKTRISLAPLFDNGMSLGLRQLSRRYWTYDEFRYLSIPCFAFYEADPQMKYAEPIEKFAFSYKKQLDSDPELFELYQKIKSLDLRAELEYVSKVSGYNLSDYELDYITKFVAYLFDVLEHIAEKDFSGGVVGEEQEEYFESYDDEDLEYQMYGFER